MTTTQDATMPRRAYSYSRISTGIQARGDGLRRQDEFAERICAEEGWCLDDALTYADRGRSGYHRHNLRPTADLARFLKDVEHGRIGSGSVLIVENLDRLSRADIDEAYDLFRKILKAGIWIATKEPRRVYRREDSGNMLAILEPLFIFARGNDESRVKAMRANDAWDKARSRARAAGRPIMAAPPCWIEKAGDGYRLHPDKASVMRRLVEMALAGQGCSAICAAMRDRGVPPLTGNKSWQPSWLLQALRGRQLVGEYQPQRRTETGRADDGPPVRDYYPALLTEDDWLRLQAAIGARWRKRGRPAVDEPNLFTGLVYDAEGVPLSLRGGYNPYGKRYSYLCNNEQRSRVRVRYEHAREAILATVVQLRPEDVLPPESRRSERERRIKELAARLAALEHRQRQLQADAADPAKDYLGPVLGQVSRDLKETARELEALKLESLTGRGEALGAAVGLIEMREAAAGEELLELDLRIKAALPSVVERITVHVEKLSPKRQVTRLEIQLRGGTVRPVRLLPRPRGT
jgi:DNA invertase Pin-like site-specific DNA recombinase